MTNQTQSSCLSADRQLPRTPTDGQAICDLAGNIWRYDAVQGTWINTGSVIATPDVTEANDGLATPAAAARIAALRQATAGDWPPSVFKIRPHVSAYWYLFKSSDRLIRFIPEGPHDLRLEIDRGRLYALAVANSCVGPPGDQGPAGDPGQDAAPGDPETCFAATVSTDGSRQDFDVVVPAPLTTDISLRLADAASTPPLLTILIAHDGIGDARLDSLASDIALDQTRTLRSITYDPSTQRLRGSLFLSAGAWSAFCLLARQKGPVGDPGLDGKCVPSLNACAVDYQGVKFTAPLVAMRKGCGDNQVLTVSGDVLGQACVAKLRIDVASPDIGALFSGSVMTGRMLAARTTTDECKSLAIFTPVLTITDPPKLELPDWQPAGDCSVSKRAESSDLNWVPHTDAAGPAWSDAAGPRSPKYPWMIMTPSAAAAGHCDPCDPNVGLGDLTGGTGPPTEPPCPGS